MSLSVVSVLTAKPLKRAGGGKGAGLGIEKYQLQSTCLSWGLPGEWQREERIEGEGSARCISVLFEFQLLLFSVSFMNH